MIRTNLPDWFFWIGAFLVALNVLAAITAPTAIQGALSFGVAGVASYFHTCFTTA